MGSKYLLEKSVTPNAWRQIKASRSLNVIDKYMAKKNLIGNRQYRIRKYSSLTKRQLQRRRK